MEVFLSDLPTEVAVQIFRNPRRVPQVVWKSDYRRHTISAFYRWFGGSVTGQDSKLINRIPEYFHKINSDLFSYLALYWFFAAIAVAVPFYVFDDIVAGVNVLTAMLLCNALWFAVRLLKSRHELHKALRTPVSLADVERVAMPNHRELELGYKDLLRKVIETPRADGNQNQILSALRVVGEAVTTLPKSESSQYLEEPEKLIRKIGDLRLRIDQESDGVVRSSYGRQLDSVEQTLAYVSQQIVHKKRLDALKEELLASIQTVILSMNASIPKNIDVGGLQILSESVRAISAEAKSFTSAVSELEDALHDVPTRRAPSEESGTVLQRLGRR